MSLCARAQPLRYYTGLNIGLGASTMLNQKKIDHNYFSLPPGFAFELGIPNLLLFKDQKIPLEINLNYQIYTVNLLHKRVYDSELLDVHNNIGTRFNTYGITVMSGYNFNTTKARITLTGGLKLSIANSVAQSFDTRTQLLNVDSAYENITFDSDLGKWTVFPSAVFSIKVGKNTNKLVYPCFYFNADFGLANIFTKDAFYTYSYTINNNTKSMNAQWQGKMVVLTTGLCLYFNTAYKKKG